MEPFKSLKKVFNIEKFLDIEQEPQPECIPEDSGINPGIGDIVDFYDYVNTIETMVDIEESQPEVSEPSQELPSNILLTGNQVNEQDIKTDSISNQETSSLADLDVETTIITEIEPEQEPEQEQEPEHKTTLVEPQEEIKLTGVEKKKGNNLLLYVGIAIIVGVIIFGVMRYSGLSDILTGTSTETSTESSTSSSSKYYTTNSDYSETSSLGFRYENGIEKLKYLV